MFMKLTPEVNFIKVKKLRFGSFFTYKRREKVPKRWFVRKMCTKNVDEIDT